jgi:hypothetical protein
MEKNHRIKVSGGRDYGLFIEVSSLHSLTLSYCSVAMFPVFPVYRSCWLYCPCCILRILISS